jgi:antitoxin VapB
MKTAKIFENGRSQAVRLPKEFRLSGKEVFVKKMGAAVLLIPTDIGWNSLIESLDKFSSSFMLDRKQIPLQLRKRIGK